MSKEKLAVMLDGGLGRVLCAIPALQVLNEQFELMVVSGGWMSAYRGSGIKAIPMGLTNQADLLKDYKVIKPEPYWELPYRNGEVNLVQAFYLSLGLEAPDGFPVPYNPETFQIGVHKPDDKPLLVLQPWGSGKALDPRSMTREEVTKIVDKYKKEYAIYIVGCDDAFKDLTDQGNVSYLKDTHELAFIRYLQVADLVIGCDSCGIHIAAASGVPHQAILATTSGIKYYKDTNKVIREGFEEMRVNPRL